MQLSDKLMSNFAKTLNQNNKSKKIKIAKAKIVANENGEYLGVKLYDGSTNYIPAKIPTNVKTDQMVNVIIQNNTVSVLGNVTEVPDDKVKYCFKSGDVTWQQTHNEGLFIYTLLEAYNINDGDLSAFAKYRRQRETGEIDLIEPIKTVNVNQDTGIVTGDIDFTLKHDRTMIKNDGVYNRTASSSGNTDILSISIEDIESLLEE
ncbi:MAG: hypothetical protein ACI35S_00750 [Anaeroplasma sp.]